MDLFTSHIKLWVVKWRKQPPNHLESVSRDHMTLLAKVWLWNLLALLEMRMENHLTGVGTHTDLPLQKFVCLTLPHPLHTTLNHVGPHLDKHMYLP